MVDRRFGKEEHPQIKSATLAMGFLTMFHGMHLLRRFQIQHVKNKSLSSTAGDNGADSVFSEPMGLNLNHDSGPANPNDLFGDTKDSGVGRSPRAPGSGSDPRSLGESSVPPAWLQDVSVHSG